ncbi:hypothetical protein ACQP1P_19605 [Dactylosporangium sp. CA-052675]|uniref:hypothetical protein n=1 Tax=Dactylosporangium sp. CA-052675 TaxID=3239927 RepID=UPI003D9336D1
MQIGLRVPVILVGLAGVLVALLMIRRLGVLSGLLGAAGSLVIAADQASNIVWILHLRSLTSGGDLDIDTFNTANNAYTVADVVLITIGVALVVASFAVRRPGGDASAGLGAGAAPAPYFGHSPFGPPSAPPGPSSAPPAPPGPSSAPPGS